MDLAQLCLELVDEYLTGAAALGFVRPNEITPARKILTKVAARAYYEARFPDAAGASPRGVWFGEYFRKIVDGADSPLDPILDQGFAVRRVLFHEFTHCLQDANTRRKCPSAAFADYRAGVAATKRRGYFSGLQEIAASMCEIALWGEYLARKQDAKPEDGKHFRHYYDNEIAAGRRFLESIKMTETDLIRATTFSPDLFSEMADRYLPSDFRAFLSGLDAMLAKTHGQS
jgi:hypothetical protein